MSEGRTTGVDYDMVPLLGEKGDLSPRQYFHFLYYSLFLSE